MLNMIVWLASYPKSGNTWIRLFLSYLLSDEKKQNINEFDNTKFKLKMDQFPIRSHFDGLTSNPNDINEFVKNCTLAQTKLNLDNKLKIYKTHNAFWKSNNYSFTDTENTSGCIYVVRDPRNVITSLKNHFQIDNIENAFKFIKDDKKLIGISKEHTAQFDLPTVISSWQNHYNSWKKLKTNYLLIKYENLLKEPLNEFNKICKFLEKLSGIKFDESEIYRSMKNVEFNKLKEQENLIGFKEAPKPKNNKTIKFFYLGPNNNWKKLLKLETIKLIESSFKSEMEELGYL